MSKQARATPLWQNWLNWLTILLLIGGTLRIFQVVLHEPLYGYANQSDMGRMQYCFGIWPQQPGINPYAGHLSAPFSFYKMDGERSVSECYVSSEMLFISVAIVSQKIINAVFDKPKNQFELHTIGTVKGVALVAAALLLTLLFHANPQVALVNAAIFALILADPYNTLWMNTLYSEFAALLFAYTSAALLYYLVSAESPKYGIAGLFIMSLFLLGLTKIQHVLLPVVLGAIWIPILLSRRHQEKKVLIALLLMGIAVLSVQKFQMNRMFHVNAANATDTYLGAVLPAMQHPEDGVKLLGLPEKCSKYVGITWYIRPGVDIEKACPEVFEVSRLRLFVLLFHEPALVVNMLKVALPQTQAWIIPYLGSVEGADYGRPDMKITSRYFSFSSFVDELSYSQFLGLYILMIAAWIYSLFPYGRKVFLRQQSSLKIDISLLWLILGSVTIVVIFSAIFGDGYSEVPKHVHLSYAFLHSFIFSILIFIIHAIFKPVINKIR